MCRAKCGNDNRDGRKFCAKCSAGLARPCPRGGAAKEPGEDFCGECGSAITDQPRSAATKVSDDIHRATAAAAGARVAPPISASQGKLPNSSAIPFAPIIVRRRDQPPRQTIRLAIGSVRGTWRCLLSPRRVIGSAGTQDFGSLFSTAMILLGHAHEWREPSYFAKRGSSVAMHLA